MATQSVSLTAALRSTLLSLQSTQKSFDVTQLRLATGKKVNTALDNPSAFFASQALTNRAGDLSNLLDSIGQAVQVLKAADGAIQTLTSYVQQAQATAQSAQSSLSNSAFIRTGDLVNTAAAGTASAADIVGTNGFAAGGNFTLTAGTGTPVTITVAAGTTLAQLAATISAQTGFSAQVVAGSLANTSRLEIRATNGQTLTVTNGTATAATIFQTGFSTGAGAGAAIGSTGTGGVITTAVAVASTTNTADQISLETQYNNILTNINTLVTDAGYQGTNLLNGDSLNVQFNEKNTSKLTVTGVTFNASGLGLSFTAGSTFLNATNITSSLNSITASLSQLRSQAQSFGTNLNIVQTRQDFTKNVINTLKEGSDALTLADKNEEGANLLSLQTAQQLGIQALSLVSQSNQSVLRLFG